MCAGTCLSWAKIYQISKLIEVSLPQMQSGFVFLLSSLFPMHHKVSHLMITPTKLFFSLMFLISSALVVRKGCFPDL